MKLRAVGVAAAAIVLRSAARRHLATGLPLAGANAPPERGSKKDDKKSGAKKDKKGKGSRAPRPRGSA